MLREREMVIAYAVIVQQHGYAYLNMPKAACTSIKEAIGKQLGHDAAWLRSASGLRCAARDIAKRTDLFRWTVVRHPAARLVSCWTETRTPRDRILQLNRGLRLKAGLPFPGFVRAVAIEDDWRANAHYAQQSYLCRDRGEWLIDMHFQLESLGDSWPAIQLLTGLGDLVHLRRSEHKPWREYYTAELRSLVETRYADDFEAFGYEW